MKENQIVTKQTLVEDLKNGKIKGLTIETVQGGQKRGTVIFLESQAIADILTAALPHIKN